MPVYGDSLVITSPTEGQTYTASGTNSLATVMVSGTCGSTSAVSVTIQHTAGPHSVSEVKTVQPNGSRWTAAGFTLMSGQSYTVSATNGSGADQKDITVV